MSTSSLSEPIPVPILITDINGSVISVNKESEKIFNLKVGEDFSAILSTSSNIFFHTHIYPTLLKDKKIAEIFFYLVDKEGQKLPFFVNASVEEHDTDIIYWVLFLAKERDKFEKNLISLKNSLEEKTENLNESLNSNTIIGKNLSNALAFQKSIFTILSHDLRSPINSIKGLTDLLLDKISTEQIEERKLITHIKKSSENVLKLIQDLIQWSKNSSKKEPSGIQLINLKSLADQEIKLLKSSMLIKNIKTENQLSDIELPFDEQVYRFILRNLLNNAIKFSPTHSQIVLKSQITDSEIELSIRDYGKGVAPHLADHIFDADMKTTEIGTKNEQGSGIGLPLCKQMIELHGGSINFMNHKDGGAVFSFSIPNSAALDHA